MTRPRCPPPAARRPTRPRCRIPRPLLLALLPVLACGEEPAPTPGARAAGSGAADLLACHDSAVGGDALRRAGEVRYELEIEEPGFTARGRYVAERAGRARIDVFVGEERVFSEGWDGAAGWQLPRGADEPEPTGEASAAALRHGLELPGHLWTLADMADRGHRVEVLPPDGTEGAGRTVKLTLADGFESWHVLDPTTCLVVRKRDFRAFHPDLDPETRWIESRFGDFRTTDGVTRPHRTVDVDLATGDTVGITRVLDVRALPGEGR